jgi:trk system potassium uptake protein TrkH
MTVLTAPQIAPPMFGRHRGLDLAETLCAILGAAALLAEYAFHEPPVPLYVCRLAQAAAVLVFLVSRLVSLRAAPDRSAFLRGYWPDMALIPAAALAASAWGAASLTAALQAGTIYVAIRQAGLIASAAAHRAAACVVPPVSRGRPIRLMLAGYLSLIILGGLLLALPKATTADHRNAPYTHLLNSAFTATSAACTSGLNVYQLPRDYTLFGQIVILALVQAGALGTLIFGTLFGMLLVRRLSREPDGPAWSDAKQVRRILVAIIAATLTVEVIGAALLYSASPDEPTVFARAFWAIFHSVAAFCNAGFTLQKDSLVTASGLWQVYGVILPLSVLGTLGFPVLYEMVHRLRRRRRDRSPLLPLPARGWSLHTKLALATILCLVLVGTLGLLTFEKPGQIGYWYVGKGNLLSQQDSAQLSSEWMRSHEGPQRFFDALFQSAVSPVAGLRTVPVDPGAMSPASQFLLMLLMLVGGAPASTAGGLKTVAFAILVLYAWGILRGRPTTNAFGREIPVCVVRRVLGLFFVSSAWLCLTILVLAHLERAAFLTVAFEAASAFSTSGLTLGLTPGLTALGKGLILLTMLAGRLGPLMLMIILAGKDEPAPSSPSDPVVLG